MSSWMSLQIEQKDYKQQFLTLFVIFIEDNLIVQRLLFFLQIAFTLFLFLQALIWL